MISGSTRHAWSSTESGGFTLIELIVTMAIVAILATMALPYAENSVKRQKETELRRALRDIRSAIDAFHRDWQDGHIPTVARLASLDGYPQTLTVLTEPYPRPNGTVARYLRRVPRDPFADPSLPAEDTWRLISYRDDVDSIVWSGEDVYDVRSKWQGEALDGTRCENW